METAKILVSGDTQTVRLPKSCRFSDPEVFIHRIGNAVILMPKSDPWGAMLKSLDLFTPDCLTGDIEDLPTQERDAL